MQMVGIEVAEGSKCIGYGKENTECMNNRTNEGNIQVRNGIDDVTGYLN